MDGDVNDVLNSVLHDVVRLTREKAILVAQVKALTMKVATNERVTDPPTGA